MIEEGKQVKYVVNIPSVEDRFQTMSAIFEPFSFKTAGPNGDHIATPSICS